MHSTKIKKRLQMFAIKLANFLLHKYYYLNENEFVKKNHKHLRLKRIFFKALPDSLCKKGAIELLYMSSNVKPSGVTMELGTDVQKDSKFYEDVIYMNFEDTKLLVPKDWDEYLTECYGDYMTPVKYNHDIIQK